MTPCGQGSTVSAEFFDDKYRSDPDPWAFGQEPYEQGRYAAILEHVPAGRYDTAYEPGCSIGVLTAALARRCRDLVARDISPTAVGIARRRCRDAPHARISVASITEPVAAVDLIVLSEVGYYLDLPTLRCTIKHLLGALRPGGRLIAAHWTGTSADHVLHGGEVHDVLRQACAPWVHQAHGHHRDPGHDGYVLDVWDRPAELT